MCPAPRGAGRAGTSRVRTAAVDERTSAPCVRPSTVILDGTFRWPTFWNGFSESVPGMREKKVILGPTLLKSLKSIFAGFQFKFISKHDNRFLFKFTSGNACETWRIRAEFYRTCCEKMTKFLNDARNMYGSKNTENLCFSRKHQRWYDRKRASVLVKILRKWAISRCPFMLVYGVLSGKFCATWRVVERIAQPMITATTPGRHRGQHFNLSSSNAPHTTTLSSPRLSNHYRKTI